jgi:hypothetical protein
MRKGAFLVVTTALTVLVVSMTLVAMSSRQGPTDWLFPELGPAVIQDTQYGRAPILDSPFSPFGDVPGGYSPYWGNPLVDELAIDDWENIELQEELNLQGPEPDISILLQGLLITVVPLTVVFVAGRRSYGTSKTR